MAEVQVGETIRYRSNERDFWETAVVRPVSRDGFLRIIDDGWQVEVAVFAPVGTAQVAITPALEEALAHLLNDEADFFEVNRGDYKETERYRQVVRDALTAAGCKGWNG